MIKQEGGNDEMGTFIEHVNRYLSEMRIKQNFISLKAEIEPSKLSRLLTGTPQMKSWERKQGFGWLWRISTWESGG